MSYGRTAFIVYESEYSSQEVEAALRVSATARLGPIPVGAGVEPKWWSADTLGKSSFTGYVLGGSGPDAVRASRGLDDVQAYITGGGNYSAESPGAPIAYSLSNLGDNAMAGAGRTVDYPVRRCERIRGRVAVKLKQVKVDSEDDVDLCGSISAWHGTTRVSLFDRDCKDGHKVTVEHEHPWEPGVQEPLEVTTRDGQSIDLHVRLVESNTLFPDQEIEYRVVNKRYEDGWRDVAEVKLSREDTSVTVVVELIPT